MPETLAWETVSYVMASKIRIGVLVSLKENRAKTPSQLAEELGSHLSHVSRALKELNEKGLIICLTPNVRKNKLYSITEKGKSVLKVISDRTG